MSSKIKVDTIENVAGSGNVSLGSGHNLVVPGDLTVDTNTLFVDASADKVGINNTTPGSYLTSDLVVGDATGDNAISVVSGNANASGVFFQDTTGNSIVSGVRYQHDINKMGLWTNGGEKASIDSTGRMLVPNQPCFSATHPTGGTLTTDGTYRVKPHNTIVTNIGGGYSTAGGGSRFTAPVAGTYMFFCFALQLANMSSMIIFGKNGSHTTHGTNSEARAISPSGTEINVAFQLILTLAENDYVEVFYRRTAGSGGWYSAHAGFSGFLIG